MSEVEEVKDEGYPATAIATWSGYVYQGKVALYHSLKLISEGDLAFELQLDSSDDFAIYKDGVIASAHQVKAKIGKSRGSYGEALEKCSKIEFDRAKGISRYLHVSVQLNNTDDYTGGSKEVVKFYPYGDKPYCALGEIEGLTKAIIKQILEKKAVILDDKLLNFNYCLLSEKISSKAVEIHRIVQEDREKASKAAYENRIAAQSLLDDLTHNNPYFNRDYYSVNLKARLEAHLEERLDQCLPALTDATYGRARRLFDHIRVTPAGELKSLCQLMKPSAEFTSIQKQDIRRYTDLVQAMSSDPILYQLPHYLDVRKRFYIPTALDVDTSEDCTSDMLEQMESNGDLLKLLFEYNHLIASKSTASFMIDTKYTRADDLESQEVQDRIDSNITKTLCITVVTKDDAEARLNDK